MDEKRGDSTDTLDCGYNEMFIEENNVTLDSIKVVEDMDISNDVLSSDQSTPKEPEIGETDVKYQDVDIGTFTDKAIPLEYCTRYIVKSFLLTGHPTHLVPDKLVRISVKSLALSCVASVVQYFPKILLLNLDRAKIIGAKCTETQKMSDLLLFCEHPDPQLRGNVASLLGNFIKAVLVTSQSDYEKWLSENGENCDIKLGKLFDLLIQVI